MGARYCSILSHSFVFLRKYTLKIPHDILQDFFLMFILGRAPIQNQVVYCLHSPPPLNFLATVNTYRIVTFFVIVIWDETLLKALFIYIFLCLFLQSVNIL